MAKPGRNDRCPCGSGKKYKSCCLTKDEATERERLAMAQAARDERAAEKHQSLREARASMLAGLAAVDGDFDDDPTEASNAVIDLIRDGKLDEAEAAARDLLVRYPQVPDGWDRLGMVHEKRGENRPAADCYRKLLAFVREHPYDFDAAIIDDTIARIDRLDPSAAD